MKEWCLAHPWMTLATVLMGMSAIQTIVVKFLDIFKEPSPIHLKVESTEQPQKPETPIVINARVVSRDKN